MSNNVDTLEALLREEFNKLEREDFTAFVETAEQEYEKINQQLGTLNVLVIGKTGVGKSTLLNAVFKEKFAATGVGRPITQNTTRYYQQGCPLSVYDTRGMELPNEADQTTIIRLKSEIKELITQNQNIQDKRIELIWYCVNARNPRFEPVEEEWLKELAQHKIPIILVLTQFFGSEPDQQFLNGLKSRGLLVETIIGVMAEDYELGNGFPVFPDQGLDTLVERTAYCLGNHEKVRQLFVQQQLANIDLKEIEAQRCVTRYTALALPAGAIPVTGADSLALWTILSAMIGEISSIFGILPNSDFITTVVTVLTGVGSGAVATSLLPSILKVFPGLGTIPAIAVAMIAYPAVAGSVGTAYTKALRVYLSYRISLGDISEEDE